MLVCGNIFSKVNQRVIIKMINEQNQLDFAEYEDPDNKINNYKREDFVVIELDESLSKISEAYIIDEYKS